MKALLAVILATVAFCANATSFNCRAAKSAVEYLICENADLGELDDELNEAYALALKSSPDLAQSQKEWLANRDNCMDADCVKHAYLERIDYLSRTPSNTDYAAVEHGSPQHSTIGIESIDLQAFCPADREGKSICLLQLGLFAQQHAIIFNQTLSRFTDKQTLIDEESSWVGSISQQCAGNYECFKRTLTERTQYLDSLQETNSAADIADDPGYMPDAPNGGLSSGADSFAVAPLAQPPTSNTPPADSVPAATPAKTNKIKPRSFDNPAGGVAIIALALIGAFFFVVVALGIAGKVVFYYDTRDFVWSLCPAIILIAAFFAAFLQQGDKSAISVTQIMILVAGGVLALIGVVKSFRSAIHYNRSLLIGLVVGACKNLVAGFMLASLLGNWDRQHRSGYYAYNEHGRRERALARNAFAILGFLWFGLVNGQRVYENKGWLLASGEQESDDRDQQDGGTFDAEDPITDYYEIMGVRRSASRDEIDLAYRGRRSQYHPDRHPAGEAQIWATERMKELNEAYAVLIDPAARSRLDEALNGFS